MKLVETNIVGEMTVIKFNESKGPGSENKLRYILNRIKILHAYFVSKQLKVTREFYVEVF